MSFPEFFAAAPRIALTDPLARFLGAVDDGVLEYAYEDAVRLAGHSCPTVASAFLMTRAALRALYPETLPERGGLRVELAGERTEGVNGVIGSVAGFITGAAGDTGFKGIGGHFERRGLLAYAASIDGQMRFTRTDDGASADVSARLERVPSDPRIGGLLPRCLMGVATPDETALFGSLWQSRVRALLLEHADDPQTFVVTLTH
jgi:hypothetical protein